MNTIIKQFTQDLGAIETNLLGGEKTEAECLSALSAAIERSVAGIKGQCPSSTEPKESQREFQAAIDPWFSQSWFMHRSRSKPRGFPGDYLILDGIYELEPKSEGFGRILDRYFLQTALARAVFQRKETVRERISFLLSNSKNRLRVLDLACGPCREIIELPCALRGRLEFVGVDLDEEALSFAAQHLGADAQLPHPSFLKRNLLRYTKESSVRSDFGDFDLIYSVGLFDYLSDEVLKKLIPSLASALSAEGLMILAFKDAEHYDATEYQWHVDWHFYQRTAEESRKLVAETGCPIVGEYRDATGIIQFLDLKKGLTKRCI